MATTKKSAKKAKRVAKSAKTTPKRATKPAAKKGARRAAAKKAKPARPALTDEAKSRLVKPPTEYPAFVERSIAQWEDNKSTLKLANSTPARLRVLLNAARKARAREEALRAQLEKRLAPLADARLLAEDAVWRQTLDLYAVAKAQGRVLPQLVEAFAFLAELYKRGAKGGDAPEPDA
jgi:hypothetical protein